MRPTLQSIVFTPREVKSRSVGQDEVKVKKAYKSVLKQRLESGRSKQTTEASASEQAEALLLEIDSKS